MELSYILKALKKAGLEPAVYHKAVQGSVYIKFGKNIGGTLRVADHPQRSRYSYRWNLRKDVKEIHTKVKGHSCYYFPANCLQDMIRAMVFESKMRTYQQPLVRGMASEV